MYKISIKLLGKEYTSSADTIVEGIIKLDYPKTSKLGLLTIKEGNKTKTISLYPRILNKLRVSKMFQEIYAKRLSVLLK